MANTSALSVILRSALVLEFFPYSHVQFHTTSLTFFSITLFPSAMTLGALSTGRIGITSGAMVHLKSAGYISTSLFVFILLLGDMYFKYFAHIVAIALRYSAVRCQFGSGKGMFGGLNDRNMNAGFYFVC